MENLCEVGKMKVAIYIRVSKRDMNPDNQKLQLVKFAESKGWEFEIFEEKESTRKTRPVKANLIQMLRERKFEGVLIWKLDRWARSLQELMLELDELTSKKIEFVVMTAPIDTTSASGRLFIQILGAFAEFERDLISERTIAGQDRARAEGKRIGRHPKGCNCGKCKQK